MSGITLEEVTELARELVRSTRRQQKAADELKAASAKVQFIEDVLLPNTLREIDMAKFLLSDGSMLSVESIVSASISADNWPDAEAWLVEQGRDGIIKNQVITEFDKGQNDNAEALKDVVAALVVAPALLKALKEFLESAGVGLATKLEVTTEMLQEDLPIADIKAKKTIHPQTLKAEVRACLKSGVAIPEETFGIFIADHAKFTPPKKEANKQAKA